MALDQLRNCNFGKNQANATGSLGVGYTVLDVSGSIITPRTTAGVYQLISGSGLYAAYVTFPDNFRGQILWDTGTVLGSTCYATEEFNVEANNPLVTATFDKVCEISCSIRDIYHFTTGRWTLSGNIMTFYEQDNATVIATYGMYDQDGNPSSDCIFERQLISGSFC